MEPNLLRRVLWKSVLPHGIILAVRVKNMTLELTIEEKELLNKLLLKARDFSLTAYPVDLDLTPKEQERVNRLLKKIDNLH